MTTPSTTQAPPQQRTILLEFTEGQVDDILGDLPLGQSVSEATRDLYVRLRDARKVPDAPEATEPPKVPLPCTPPESDDAILYAPPQTVRPAPEREPSRGTVIRKVDITGISGLGLIAEFCVFSDGACAIRWLSGPPQNQSKWEFYDEPGIEPFVQISGHNGNTEIVWIDEPAPQQ